MNFIDKLFQRKKNPTLPSTPDSSNPLIGQLEAQARQSYQKGDYQTALSHCQEVLKLNPTHAGAYYIQGLAKYQLEDSAGASQDLHYALTLAERIDN